jgi:hypothetical protein
MPQILLSQIQGRPPWIGLWWQLLPTTLTCVYKMLVACASDTEGRSLFISRMLCSSLLLQTLLIPNKTKHNIHDIQKDFFSTLWIVPQAPIQIELQNAKLPKLEMHSQKTGNWVILQKKSHMWTWCFHKYHSNHNCLVAANYAKPPLNYVGHQLNFHK